MRRGEGGPTPIGTLVAKTAVGRAASSLAVSRPVWEDVAGVVFAQRTRPGKIARGVLYVAVASSAWAQELALHAPVILDRLRAKGIEVEKLRFRVGEVEPWERGGAIAPAREDRERARGVTAAEEALTPLGRVDDAPLRTALARAADAIARRDAEAELLEKSAKKKRVATVPGSRGDSEK